MVHLRKLKIKELILRKRKVNLNLEIMKPKKIYNHNYRKSILILSTYDIRSKMLMKGDD